MKTPQGVAPPDIVRQDFRVLDARETLRTTWPIEQLILIQSVQGHAHEGHGVFRGRRFPNTTLDDITRALRLDPPVIRQERQDLIDGIAWYADQVVAGTPPRGLIDAHNRPLVGMSFLRFLDVDPLDVLTGLYLGGLRDQPEVRQEVQRRRGIRIGRGKCFYVDMEALRRAGLAADELAKGAWDDQIDDLRRRGIIVDGDRANDPDVAWQYVRYEQGPGASDDTAIVGAGLLWGLGAAVGMFLADAIDTLEKYVPAYSDQDAGLSSRIQATFPGLRVGYEEALTLTFLAATPEGRERDAPDSSLRHMLSIDRHEDLCPIEAHFLAVMGVPAPNVGLSHERSSSLRFYDYVRERVASLR